MDHHVPSCYHSCSGLSFCSDCSSHFGHIYTLGCNNHSSDFSFLHLGANYTDLKLGRLDRNPPSDHYVHMYPLHNPPSDH